jgi:hypothetical protein
MNHIKKFDEFLNEGMIEEDTAPDYKYHFKYEGKMHYIHQGKDDESIFGIKGKDGDWYVMTKGDLFDPAKNDMEKKEFLSFLQRGVKYFNIRGEVDINDVKDSEWAKFFKFELAKKPGRINKKYCVLKMHCGKASAKWHSRK